MAKFSRSSTAYKSDGSVVNAGVPRFEADKAQPNNQERAQAIGQ